MTWVCICGKEHESVRDAEDCCQSYIMEKHEGEEDDE
jgi:hypothetical protein